MKPSELRDQKNGGLRFQELVVRILSGDPEAPKELEAELHSGIRFYLRRRLESGDIDRHIRTVQREIVQAIRNLDIVDAAGLFSGARSILASYVAIHQPVEISRSVSNGARHGRQDALATLVGRSLGAFSKREIAALSQFYIQNQEEDRICQALGISREQLLRMRTRLRSAVASSLSQSSGLSAPCQ